MNNCNNNNRNNSNSEFGNRPFAGLSSEGGKLSLATGADETPKETKAPVVIRQVTPDRRPMALPRRGERATTSCFPKVTPDAVQATEAAPVETAPVVEAAPELTGWALLEQHQKSGKAIRGNITQVVYSREKRTEVIGIRARVGGILGFVPARMMGMSVEDAERSVTLEMAFRVLELQKGENGEKDRIILNRQLEIAEENTARLLAQVKLGDTVSGTIRSVKHFGAFVDINGASALIRITELPRGSVKSVKVGDKVEAVVIKADRKGNQIGLSIKHHRITQISAGQTFSGPVKNVEKFGVFVELNDCVDGLIHVSQFGDLQPVKGSVVSGKVLSVNYEKAQVQLSLLDVVAPKVAE